MFLYYLTSEKKKDLTKENFIPPCQTDPLARVHMENFHIT